MLDESYEPVFIEDLLEEASDVREGKVFEVRSLICSLFETKIEYYNTEIFLILIDRIPGAL